MACGTPRLPSLRFPTNRIDKQTNRLVFEYMDQAKPHPTRERILKTALQVIRERGLADTSIMDLCAAAGITKGAFFHHFSSKEDLAIAATRYWTETTGQFFANASYNDYDDPLDRLVAYIDFRAAIIKGRNLPEFTCLLGTMAQEVYESQPDVRAACGIGIDSHAATVKKLIEEAKAAHAPRATWSAEGLALHTQAVIQGAFIVAKAKNDPQLAIDSIIHLRRYIELLFHHAKED
jgi:TetR/AcrR family transcriptional regulator, transcriptional repressor for nem operon